MEDQHKCGHSTGTAIPPALVDFYETAVNLLFSSLKGLIRDTVELLQKFQPCSRCNGSSTTEVKHIQKVSNSSVQENPNKLADASLQGESFKVGVNKVTALLTPEFFAATLDALSVFGKRLAI